MAAIPGEYEDGGDEEFTLPLPPEDRLWRHPSELGDNDFSLRLDPASVRNRWLSSQPSRASAWTAGLVGALLASGVVVLGTHLATTLTAAPSSASKVTLTSIDHGTVATPTSARPQLSGLGSSVLASVERVGGAVVSIEAATATSDLHILGVIIAKNGTVLTAASALDGATSVFVTYPGNEVPLPAVSISSDPQSGLAVLRVNGINNLPVTTLASEPVAPQSLAIAVTAAGGTRYALGNVQQIDVAPRLGANSLVDASTTDLPAGDSPPGSPVLDGHGQVVGLVAGASGAEAVVVPSWLALPISKQLMTSGAVEHGWLGITGETTGVRVDGALVKSVIPAGAGAEAGIRAGDVITAVDGKTVTSMPALQGRLYILRPGAQVVLSFSQGDAHLTRRLTLDDASGS